jgi:hypothetical protein
MKHQTIHLRVYKQKAGVSGIVRDESGNVINENHLFKCSINTMEWKNWLKHVKNSGFIKIDIIGMYESIDGNGMFQYSEVPEEIKKSIESSMNPSEEIVLTPDQKRIADLEAKLESLIGGNKAPKKDIKSSIDPELAEARKEYFETFGKKGHHSWKAEEITEKIKNKELTKA